MLANQALSIFTSLERAINIVDLNLSWNSLPNYNIFKFKPISVFLNINKNLMHLNMSYMNLSVD